MTSSQQRANEQVRQDRRVLFDDGLKKRRSRKPATASSTAAEAASIQNSLLRTQHLLQNELGRTSQVASAIDQDGKLLQDTKQTHDTLNVKKAKSALTSLQRAQQKEQRVLLASIVFFWFVVVYILFVRVIMHIPFVDRLLASIRFW